MGEPTTPLADDRPWVQRLSGQEALLSQLVGSLQALGPVEQEGLRAFVEDIVAGVAASLDGVPWQPGPSPVPPRARASGLLVMRPLLRDWVTAAGGGRDQERRVEEVLDGLTQGAIRELAEATQVETSRVEGLLRELRRERLRLRSLLEQLPLAVAVVDASTGETVLANEQNAAIFRQRSPEARRGAAYYAAYKGFHDDGRPIAPEEWPLARSLRTGEIVRGEEKQILRGDNTAGYIRMNSSPIRDETGAPMGAVVIYEDVTAQRRSEDGLRFIAEASALLGSSLDYETTLKTLAHIAVPQLGDWCAIEMAQPDGSFQMLALAHADPAKVRLAEELRRRFPPQPDDATGVSRVLGTGEPDLYEDISDEFLERTMHDPEKLALVRALGLRSSVQVPITARDRVLGVMTLASGEGGRRYSRADVTLLQQVANRAGLAVENALLYTEAQNAIRLREDFLSIASHELRTPLTTLELQVSAFISRAKSDVPMGVTLEKLERIDAQVGRMNALINQLLDVSHISAGRLALQREMIDLAVVAQETVSRFADSAAEARSIVRLECSGAVVGLWDRERLEQVMANLMGNALKYGAGEPVSVVVEENDGVARLTVSDQGFGIDRADHERIFERFERATSPRKFGGIGLGLWIVKEIVTAHGGTVRVASLPNQGATFIVELPMTPDPSRESSP